LVNQEAVEWLLHGTSVQLQQCSTIWHDPIASSIPFLPSFEATIVTGRLQLQANFDTLELSIEPVLHAELSLIDVVGTNPAFGRIKEGFEGVRQLLRSISIFEEAIDLTSFYHYSIYTSLHTPAFPQTFHFTIQIPIPPLISFIRLGVLLLYDTCCCKKALCGAYITSRLVFGIKKFPWVISIGA